MSDIGQLPSPAIGISLSVDVAKGRNLVFQTHLEQSSPLAFINEQLDKLNSAADRQQAIYEIEGYEFQLHHDEKRLAVFTNQLNEIAIRESNKAAEWANSDRRGEYRTSEPELKRAAELRQSLKDLEETLKFTRKRIEDLKAKVGEKAAA